MRKPSATIVLKATEDGRLDRALTLAAAMCADDTAQLLAEGLSRARVQALIKSGHVNRQSDGTTIHDPNHRAHDGEAYVLALPPPLAAKPEAQVMALSVVYEDDDLLVIDKPAGLVVHPAAGHLAGTLVNALLAHCGASLSGIGGVARPGIVHRLDKDTSGLMVVAKNDFAHQRLSAQFSDRSLSRVYQAVVWGLPAPSTGEIRGAIGRHPRARQKMAVVARGGKEALTRYQTIETFGAKAALVSCSLATGRTHQIRVHMAHIGHPLVGDPVYGKRPKGASADLLAFSRQALHAGEIRFIHPRTEKAMRFKAPLPAFMKALLKELKKGT